MLRGLTVSCSSELVLIEMSKPMFILINLENNKFPCF